MWLVKKDTDNKNLPVGKELGSQSRQTLLVEGTDADQDHLKGDSVSTTKYLKKRYHFGVGSLVLCRDGW